MRHLLVFPGRPSTSTELGVHKTDSVLVKIENYSCNEWKICRIIDNSTCQDCRVNMIDRIPS